MSITFAFLARAVEPHGFRCGVIPNVIDIRLYPFRLRRAIAPRFFWMRSFHPVYNPLMAVKVLERLRATHPEATLVMGGQDKGMQAEVERYAPRSWPRRRGAPPELPRYGAKTA
ncbi:MAG: hypothetical protein AUI47_00875 [Acidobacteria bacterium 13_1_40CM_2_68_5]|nr:MAG: hypothetical protein AUI47_00875 [Acidobacteria bacterium 13_1_40CM_2_68_5]